ncbi:MULTISPECIES: heavy metal translocating P-type ATPase [Bacillus]|uniref:heavy metal translocating P-type ATPase n=1 Tax=Bacillus TaxID=1386 RepID=UPI000BB922DD|nr:MULTISPECIES: heavy metal translocating P-type ATPase [Bacillus]
MENKKEYRLQGLTCTNCAAKFETNVKEITGVEEAKINYGAAKITVYGKTTIKELEKAGAFDQIKVTELAHNVSEEQKVPLYQKHWRVLLSFVALIVGWYFFFTLGEDHYATISAFAVTIIVGGYRLFLIGLKNLSRLQFDMKTLMTIAIIGAAIIGEWAEGATVVILFAISEALETYSMEKARSSIRSLMNIAPKKALIKRNNEERYVSVEEIEVNDIMIVKPGEKLAMDGKILRGVAAINTAAITGESIPLTKTIGDDVYAGTLNEDGFIEVEVTKRVEDTTLSKIIYLVEEAQAERAPSQAFVDKFAKYYTPLIMVIAFLVAVIPPLLFGLSWEAWIYQGLAVLVVGCPCALVISTPISIVTAIGNAARNGVLIKGGIHLEQLGAIRAIAFDKTGTLTKGTPVVTDVIELEASNEELLKKVMAIEKGSSHPLAKSIVNHIEKIKMGESKTLDVENIIAIPGKGVSGTINGEKYNIGSPNWFMESEHPTISSYINRITELQNEGKTVMVAGTPQRIEGIIALRDEVRTSSKNVISKLKEFGIEKTVLLTGDNKRTAEVIKHQLGVDEVHAELLPEQKLRLVKKLRDNYNHVAMVGDGINDAPALAAADIGVAMGGAGTDTALETADVALMADDLQKLPYAISLSKKTLQIIKQNIAFSIGLKILALLLVIPGWLTLWIAIFADMGATVLVTLNSLRLLKIKNK